MLPRSQRISKEVFKETQTKGLIFHSPLFFLKCSNTDSGSRFAVVISKKIAKTAVIRNRVKRRIYSIVKDLIPRFVIKRSVVITIKKNIEDISHDVLKKEIEYAFVKSGLLK
jgi:ribonuclease P protein component